MAACSDRTLRRNCKQNFDFIVSECKRPRRDSERTTPDDTADSPENNFGFEDLNSSYLENVADFDGK